MMILHEVGRVLKSAQTDEALLDAARADEAQEQVHAARLVVRPARASAAERLLPDDGARALLVVVDVAGRVAQTVGRLEQRLALRGETALSICQLRKRK